MIRGRKTEKKKASRGQRGMRKLVDLKALTGYGITTYGHGDIAFFSVKPTNLSVLTPESLTARINALLNVLKGVAEITMLCLSSRENYHENKQYLRERLDKEENAEIKRQLEHDILFLDSEQTSMATAREFFLVLHLRGENPLEIPPYLSHVEQIVREQGFMVRRAEREDIMRIFAMYFEQYTYFKKNGGNSALESFAGILVSVKKAVTLKESRSDGMRFARIGNITGQKELQIIQIVANVPIGRVFENIC